MQKYLAAVLCLAAASLADVSHLVQQRSQEVDASIVRQTADIVPPGDYNYGYETSNGIVGQEQGQVQNVGSENEAIAVQGGFSYQAPDGSPIQLTYTADANGFQPQGAHLPTPPPVPEYILRSLAYIAAHPEQAEKSQKRF